ncbi:universal stress protein PHOS34-like [Diospyros lotus]|uniref:universal stress protein PHOS34-like n=1 Tax=Diospyros lotus TaxID=55363 RepID=UPI00225A4861|nr:universal stress protein PHOS34-like [Diospyros lotus]
MESQAVETSTAVGAGDEAAPVQVQEQEQMPPVLEEKKQMKVLVAVDESDESFYALQWALDHLFPSPAVAAGVAAVAEPNQELGMVTVTHVLYPFQTYVLPAGPAVIASSTVVQSVRTAQEKNAAALLSRALQMCQQKMINAETLILEGDAKEMICQAAEQMHVDLVVVGSRGLGRVKRAFLGSVSDYCAHHVRCPILIVKPPK